MRLGGKTLVLQLEWVSRSFQVDRLYVYRTVSTWVPGMEGVISFITASVAEMVQQQQSAISINGSNGSRGIQAASIAHSRLLYNGGGWM